MLDDTPDPEKEEEARDVSLDEITDEGDIPSYRTRVSNWGKDPRPEYNTFSVRQSFTQSLMDQLGYRDLSPEEYAIASFIIGSLDADGYLRRDLESLVDDMAFRAGISTDVDEVLRMLAVVQELEPSGVGARDLRECLLLQLRSGKQSRDTVNAERILEEYFPEFSNKHFQKIMTRLNLSEDDLKRAMARIVKLNPAPGGETDYTYTDQAQQIIPDFVLEEENGVLRFSMPRFSVPELRVNKKYADLLIEARGSSERAQKEAATFVRQKLDSAKWFVEALKQRQNTLSRTMSAILDYQHDYFVSGDEADLKPMVLKNSKYIETHFGIFPLKYFFSEGMENKEGEEVSTRELKKALQECVDAEDKKKPLTDEQLVEEMGRRGYKVARRTIAKYRGQLGIPLARWRKEL